MKEKPLVVFDIECYRNYFLVYFRSITNGKSTYFEAYVDPDTGEVVDLDTEGLARTLRNVRLVSFNGNNYDVPMATYALKCVSCSKLKDASDAIITQKNMKPWVFEETFDCKINRDLDHIDLMEVAPGRASLKIYGGRLHSQKMQDLPIEPDAIINAEQREALRLYCGNDLQTTADLYNALKPQLELREAMTEQYGIDLRSKSDAQIAEAVIKQAVTKAMGRKPVRPEIKDGTKFKYSVPPMVSFRTQALRDVLQTVRACEFVIDNGKLQEPDELADLLIPIGGSVYRMGIGGLHSSEQSTSHVADTDTLLIDRDVRSYYPSLILLMGLAPKHLGAAFTEVYKGIVERRLAAKEAGRKIEDAVLKIVINGSFGKFGSMWSVLYSPRLLIQTTVTGQLALLMLIEALELAGIPVVSANTDGIVIKCPKALEATMNGIVFEWELFTGLETEGTEYQALFSRDVNNYLAIKKDGKTKAKGVYALAGLAKNPTNVICIEAVTEYLTKGTPILTTITECRDVRKFVTIRSVKGGALKGEQFLGKAVRWYYARGEDGAIHYKSNGYLVPRSEGARPLMELPAEYAIPADLDHAFYVAESYRQLDEIGYRHPRVDE